MRNVSRDQDEVFLFHYTNPLGSEGILNEKVIRVTQSGSRFSWFGQGVYMTSLSPASGRDHILYNNHHKRKTLDPNLWAKTEVYFKIHSASLPGVKKVSDKFERDIYLCPRSIDLRRVPYETGLSEKYQEVKEIHLRRRKPLPLRSSSRITALRFPSLELSVSKAIKTLFYILFAFIVFVYLQLGFT